MAGTRTGTVTFLFTDIEGSTKLWEGSPEAMRVALVRHDEILRETIETSGGYIFKTVGDAFCTVFHTAQDALEAALTSQRVLFSEEWSEDIGSLRVRMALHTGEAEERDGDYFGPPLNRVARLLSSGHGGQILLSLAAQELVRDQLPEETALRDLGERRLKDLVRPERIFQLTVPDLPSEFPPLRTLEGRPNNLPLQPTPLVGRKREVAEVTQRLLASETRLLTLTGPGGTGKTRLALQAAADLLGAFEDGTFFVSLAALTDPELVTSAIASPLGVVEAADRSLEEGLRKYLRKKRVLLVLDNFEQVLEGARLVGQLLSTCLDLKVLATSRIPLGLYGEREYLVPPLSLPDPERLPSLESLTRYEAVGLFVERAQEARPDFSVTNENAPAVAEICARLDGLPLAIELAAARIKVLPPQKMLDRLSDRLKILARGARDLPERQRTLRASMEWSHALLDEGEKVLFARLSVFAGGRTLEAIEAVCDPEGTLPIDVLDGVESLVDKSLLREEEGVWGEPRFVMLETVHEYAREKLEESGEAEELRRRHAQYFLALAEEAEPELKGPRQFDWVERLEAEHDNMRAAFSWLLEVGDIELGLRLAGALRRFWHVRGYFEEGRRRLEQALAKEGWTSASARAKALDAVGGLAHDQGDIERAEAAAREGLELSARADTESSRVASFKRTLGITAEREGDYERATGLHEESLALYRETEDKWSIAASLISLGNILVARDEHERAKEIYREALILSRESGDPEQYATGLANLGYEHLLEGDHEQATALNEEAARLYRDRGSRGGLVYALDNLAWAALVRGDHERAKALHEETLALCRELGDKLIGSESLEGLACAAAARGEDERSARLFGTASTLGYQQAPAERALREPYLTDARSRLEEAAWKVAWAEGQAMTFEEAVAYALEEEADADMAASGNSENVSSKRSGE
jgi:predicted ATPase/class 3 adenylate cyclase/Tfp pilus assembly protein PilF